MLELLVSLVVCWLIIGLIIWVVDYVPVPHPINKIIKVVAIVIGAVWTIYLLLGLAGNVPRLPR
jgi:hypothetical protein